MLFRSAFGVLLSMAGLVLLAVYSTWLATLLTLGTLVVYLGIYTPLKRRSPIATRSSRSSRNTRCI